MKESIIEKALIKRNDNMLNPSNVIYIENRINFTLNSTFKNIPIKIQMKLLYWIEVFVLSFLTIGNKQTILGKVIILLEKIKILIDKLIPFNDKKEIDIKANKHIDSLVLSDEYEHDVLLLIVTIIYELSAFLIGHNNFTQILVVILTIWFVVPCCFIVDFTMSFSGGMFNLDSIMGLANDLFISFGVLGLCLFPFFVILLLPSMFIGGISDLINMVKLSVSYLYADVFN
jgi:hypothetical protein